MAFAQDPPQTVAAPSPKVYPFSLFLAWVEGLKKEELGKPHALCEQISFGSFIVPG
jgi:hypothetical protein